MCNPIIENRKLISKAENKSAKFDNDESSLMMMMNLVIYSRVSKRFIKILFKNDQDFFCKRIHQTQSGKKSLELHFSVKFIINVYKNRKFQSTNYRLLI